MFAIIYSLPHKRNVNTMRYEVIEWAPFFDGKIIRKRKHSNRLYASAAVGYVAADLGIARALEPLKMIIAECSDPVCFIGGALGLYRVSIGEREEGFKQILNAALAQAGFFIWPKVQAAIRVGLGG